MTLLYSSSENHFKYRDIITAEAYAEFSDKIFAHTSDTKSPETLIEHSDRTLQLFYILLENLSVREIIDRLIADMYMELNIQETELLKSTFRDFVWRIIITSIYFHDIGKINFKFQKKKLGNNNELRYFNQVFPNTEHSKYSSYLLNNLLLKELEGIIPAEENWSLVYKLLYVCVPIISITDRHHSALNDIQELIESRYQEDEAENFTEIIKKTTVLPCLFQGQYNFQTLWFSALNEKKRMKNVSIWDKTSLFFLYKLLYSLLITADYYATLCYKKDIQPKDIDFCTLNNEIVESIKSNFYSNRTYNRRIGNTKEADRLRSATIDSLTNLTDLRSKILIEASDNLKKYLGESKSRIFFLNVPTGGGKTNVSMKLIIDILTHSNGEKIKRGYYVFPYVNIIEQNYKELVATLTTGEANQEVVSKIYSCNEWDFSLKDEDEELEYYINQQFLNSPLNVISSVNFFNTFIKNGKKINYKTFNLTNSIFILDEIQTIPNHLWPYLSKLINEIAQKYNSYFILMSATLPDLSLFLDTKGKTNVKNLIENPETYQRHRCFERTTVNFITGKVEVDNENFIKFLKDTIKKEKDHSGKTKIKALCVVNTIKNSYHLYDKLSKSLKEFDVFILNSTILPSRRKEMIGILNQKNEELDNDILLVSTQSVEAGVDIDCNFGFREMAPLDSIEQICGRINRESTRKKRQSTLYVFDLDTMKYVYKKDYRTKVQNCYQYKELENIIDNKKFAEFYTKVIGYIQDEEKEIQRTYNELEEPTSNLKFQELAKNYIIKDDNFTFFLPIKLDLKSLNLTNETKKYLEALSVKIQDHIDGENIWRIYKDALKLDKTNKNVFVEAKKLQSIMNNFTFSLINRRVDCDRSLLEAIQNHIDSGDFESRGGFIKVNKDFLKKIGYSLKEGLNPENLEDFFKSNVNNII